MDGTQDPQAPKGVFSRLMQKKWVRIVLGVLAFSVVCSIVGSCSGSGGSGSSSSSSSASSSASSSSATALTAEDFVGSWKTVYLKANGAEYDQSTLAEMEKEGLNPYLDLNEDGSALITAAATKTNYTWGVTDDGTWYIQDVSNDTKVKMTIESGVLSIGADEWKFVKIDPADKVAYVEPEETSASASTDSGSSDQSANTGEVTPSFKETMDSYEAFFDEYVAFMQEYANGGSSVSMLSDYATMMSRYSEAMSALDSIDTDSLSTADYAYYLEVLGRIQQKLLTVAG